MPRNPFDDEQVGRSRGNPFGADDSGLGEPIARIENAARKIRGLRTQMGAEGLTLSATRELIDELTAALDATARVLRERA